MAMTERGISTTEVGQFRHEEYYSQVAKGKRVQWDYRDTKGILHSGIAKTLEEAKAKAAQFGYQG